MKLAVISDIHYAGPAEQARQGFEIRSIGNPALRLAARAWRRWIWLHDPMAHNHRLDRLIAANPGPDHVVANGDFTVDSAFVGVSDDAALESAHQALNRLRQAYGPRLLATIGDHELGKQSLFGGVGGLRLESWKRCQLRLGLDPIWHREFGPWALIGVASTPVALPIYGPEILPEERTAWNEVADTLWTGIREAFSRVESGQRIVLFVHDPSALPFLGRDATVARHLPQIAKTIVGHLHSPSIFRLGQRLAGMPRIHFLGNTVRRHSVALNEARWWRKFRVELCPSPCGIQLFKDGGWLELDLDPEGRKPISIHRQPLPW
ncbi:MAG: hypothetical protein RIS76_79 [Verrucomicrobiota bacterium]|jgi:Calcineurin-like phosphoesterase